MAWKDLEVFKNAEVVRLCEGDIVFGGKEKFVQYPEKEDWYNTICQLADEIGRKPDVVAYLNYEGNCNDAYAILVGNVGTGKVNPTGMYVKIPLSKPEDEPMVWGALQQNDAIIPRAYECDFSYNGFIYVGMLLDSKEFKSLEQGKSVKVTDCEQITKTLTASKAFTD